MKMLCRRPVTRPVGRFPRSALTDTTDGTENQCVMPPVDQVVDWRKQIRRAAGETSVAPPPQVTNRSNTDGSKVRSNVCDIRQPGPTAYLAMLCATYGDTLRCLIGTPFGRPVEPEVKRTYATSSSAAPIGWQDVGFRCV